jgi:methyl-accepting chemotaxis protein
VKRQTEAELDAMIRSLSAVADNIEQIITFLTDSSQSHAAALEEISASSEEVLSSSENIHDLTDQQNNLVQDITADIQEVLQIVTSAGNEMKHAYDIKEVLNKSIGCAETDLAQTQKILEDLVVSFTDIAKAAEVLEEIADDINLLSLNARIEASRGGEAGRGFAVVAEAIGSLATNTQVNAKEINTVFKTNYDIIVNVKTQLDVLRRSFLSMINHTKDFGSRIDVVAELAAKDHTISKHNAERALSLAQISEIINSSTNEQKLAVEESTRSITDIGEGVQRIAGESDRLTAMCRELLGVVESMKSISKKFTM